MQEVKTFLFGSKGKETNMMPLPDQLNQFIRENRNYSVKTLAVMNTSFYNEMIVVFDVYEPSQRQNARSEHKTTTYDPQRQTTAGQTERPKIMKSDS